jgi:leucyl aminopeptidase (aminopeptidase T)
MGITLSDIARFAIDNCAKTMPGERVLILAETDTSEGIKWAFLEVAGSIAGDDVALVTYTNRPAYTHPPEPIPTAICEADLVICLDIYLSHTELEKEARASGTRFLNLHPASHAVLRRSFMGVDYEAMRKTGERIARAFGTGRDLVIHTRPEGLLRMRIDSSRAVYLGHGMPRNRGDYETIPNGKIKVPIVRESIDGTFVVNGVIIPPVNRLKETVTLTFEKGWVVKIEGGREAKQYDDFLKSFNDPSMYCFDHQTFGFNPKATLDQPPPPAFSSEAEKVMGCVNIGLGRAGLKGKQHTDVVSIDATVTLDGDIIIKKRRYLV